VNRGEEPTGLGAVALVSLSSLALMSVCCGGPLLALAGAAIGPALLSFIGVPTIVGLAAGVAAVTGIVWWRRRACAACAPPSETDLDVARVRRSAEDGRLGSRSPERNGTAPGTKSDERRDPAPADDSRARELLIGR
jgi:hypothetical protein